MRTVERTETFSSIDKILIVDDVPWESVHKTNTLKSREYCVCSMLVLAWFYVNRFFPQKEMKKLTTHVLQNGSDFNRIRGGNWQIKRLGGEICLGSGFQFQFSFFFSDKKMRCVVRFTNVGLRVFPDSRESISDALWSMNTFNSRPQLKQQLF